MEKFDGVTKARRIAVEVFERDKWRCHYCRLTIVDGLHHGHPRRATVDHKTPRSKGGSDRKSNLVASCNACNSEKASMRYEVYWWYRHMKLRGHKRDELLAAIEEVESDAEFIAERFGRP